MNGRENGNNSRKKYLLLQLVLALISLLVLGAGSIYFEKYMTEILTSLLVTLVLGAVYGMAVQEQEQKYGSLLILHTVTMVMISAGFLMDGFLKPVSAASILIGCFLTPEAGLMAAVYYGITAVLYTMETGELLIAYLLIAVIAVYFLRPLLRSKNLMQKVCGAAMLFVLQSLMVSGLKYYMYGSAEGISGLVSGAILTVVVVLLLILAEKTVHKAEKTEKPEKALGTKYMQQKDGERKQKDSMLLKSRKRKEKRPEEMQEDQLLLEIKSRSTALYEHSRKVGQVAEAVTRVIDADVTVARLGGYYHDIGKITEEEDYVAAGMRLCKEKGVTPAVIQVIAEHNVNVALPSSREAAVVMLADTVISTMEYNQKKGKETNRELLVEKTFRIRKGKGSLRKSGLSEIDLELMEEAMKKEVENL